MEQDSPGESLRANPLCVDLDGTLIRTDLLFETLLSSFKSSPTAIAFVPLWWSKGRAHLKRMLASSVVFEPELLPYNEELLEFLRDEARKGRSIILVTASDVRLARKVAEYVGVFSDVIGSDGTTNVKGETKAAILVGRFGAGNFEYVGDSTADHAVWKRSGGAYVVDRGRNLQSQINASVPVRRIFLDQGFSASALVRSLRVYQWVKNLLLFIPIVMAHQLSDVERWSGVLLAFLSMSVCASAVYTLNDLLDLNADRLHPTKRNRPFAKGDLSILLGIALTPALVLLGVLLAFLVGTQFLAALCVYLVLTTAYSFVLKQVPLVDIITLASLYTLRIIAGGYAAQVPVSEWLRAFSMFFFLSLACVKRYSELQQLKVRRLQASRGRGYVVSDLDVIGNFGTTSGYLSVLVLALYINDLTPSSLGIGGSELYRHPQVLWCICPLVLYWISRVWLLSHRGHLHEDPVLFALRDWQSYLVGALGLLVVVGAV